MGQRQVGAGPPGPGAEVPLALAAVGARGVVLTLALQAALAHGAQVGVQVALAPVGTQGQRRQRAQRAQRAHGRPAGKVLGLARRGEGTLEAPNPTRHDSPSGPESRLPLTWRESPGPPGSFPRGPQDSELPAHSPF